ncbi:ATP-binding protein [Frankia sp. QA3]|uniref:ATP-binding protein n=1 Tax=Frankia sp. QA3 TaxID=710111 RepID=UPI0002FD3074|nr:ATP-binding protein [Frankia sp. QA3]
MPDVVRERVLSVLSLIENHETLFVTWNLAKIDPYRRGVAINLYGPSGTGKSLCAEAIAHQTGRPFINVNYAQIESRYVGQTPKNIEAAFDAARDARAVVIFDEADALLGSRLSNVTQSADHAVNMSRTTMLRQLDLFDGVVVFTTNYPKNYDAAFVRRILAHVRFELPDLETRLRLWRHMLPDELPCADDVDSEILARESDGLAGGDLVNVVVAAATIAVNRPAQRRVRLADLTAEIAAVRRARAEVGKSPPDARVVSWEPAPAGIAPDEAGTAGGVS